MSHQPHNNNPYTCISRCCGQSYLRLERSRTNNMSEAKEGHATDGISTTEFEDSVSVNINLPSEGSMAKTAGHASQTPTKVELAAKVCPVDGVTVFLDRAEVKRMIQVDLKAGENEVLITELPQVLDEDSIRVTCLGEAKIIEVSHKSRKAYHVVEKDPNAEKTEAKKKALNEKKIQLMKDIEQLEYTIELLEKERIFLSKFGERLGPNDKVNEKLIESFDKKSMECVASFLSFYHTQGQKVCTELFELRTRMKSSRKEIKEIDEELDELAKLWGKSESSYTEKQVLILLEANQDSNLQLILSYVVTNASWSPSYDLRAFSQDNTLHLLYFGNIKQSTGEDWLDAMLSLSTAMPSVGGSPPDLDTLHVSTIGQNSRARNHQSRAMVGKEALLEYGLMESSGMQKKSARLKMSFRGSKMLDTSSQSYIPTEVYEGMTSATFEIARKSTINSDAVSHKVSIGQVEFKPTFEYEAVPKLVAHAFLTAKVKNNSNYALLDGPANVFLDNNFLTKSFMNAVSPQEEFEVSLGVDAAVKITHKPVQKFEKKSGLVTKYKQLEFQQDIVVKNTKASSVKIKITEQLPKSSQDKLKVNLIEPDIPLPKQKNDLIVNAPIRLTDKNHVEWTKEIGAYKTEELRLKYVIEFPANCDLSMS